jgi:hypothetical protein
MDVDDRGETPRLVALPRTAALHAGRDATVELWVRLLVPPAPFVRGRPRATAGLRAVRLYARPSAGVSVSLLQAHPHIGAPTGELGWLLPDVPPGGEADALLRLRVDRGLAVQGSAAPLLWLRAAGVDASGAPRTLAAPALLLPVLGSDAFERLEPDAAVARRIAGLAGPVDTCGQR